MADDCMQCREWELCPFHPNENGIVVGECAANCGSMLCEQEGGPDCLNRVVSEEERLKHQGEIRAYARAIDPSWRLLGPDDPEVSDDMIYAVPGGGVVGVPR